MSQELMFPVDGSTDMLDVLIESACTMKVKLLNDLYLTVIQDEQFTLLQRLAYIAHLHDHALSEINSDTVMSLLEFILTNDLTAQLIATDDHYLLIDILVDTKIDKDKKLIQSYINILKLFSYPKKKLFLEYVNGSAMGDAARLNMVTLLFESELSLFLFTETSWVDGQLAYLVVLMDSIPLTYMDILRKEIVDNFDKITVNKTSLARLVSNLNPINDSQAARKKEIVEFIELNTGSNYGIPIDVVSENLIADTEKQIAATEKEIASTRNDDDSLKTPSVNLAPSNILITTNAHGIHRHHKRLHLRPPHQITLEPNNNIIKPSAFRNFRNKWNVLPFKYKLLALTMVLGGLATILLGVFLPPSLAFTLPALKLSGSAFLSIIGGTVIASTLVGHAAHIHRQPMEEVIFPDKSPLETTTEDEVTLVSSLQNSIGSHVEEVNLEPDSPSSPPSNHSNRVIHYRLAKARAIHDNSSLSLHNDQQPDSKDNSLERNSVSYNVSSLAREIDGHLTDANLSNENSENEVLENEGSDNENSVNEGSDNENSDTQGRQPHFRSGVINIHHSMAISGQTHSGGNSDRIYRHYRRYSH
jgi:hypothetical protein